ncbi:CHRD domain-containing protein [Halomontanus rarus]|uniref:CHRD domain-containing protein n=1 Tax=Halomontanus rarus TaxID=3034020 RepID=UPI001A98D33A
MQEFDTSRRTALKVLALLGVGATGGAGATVGDDNHDGDDAEDDQHDDGEPDPAELFVAFLEPQDGVESNARGAAAVQARQGALKFAVGVSNLENTMMGHIHENEALGPVAVWLYDFATQAERLEEGQFTGLLDVGTITDEVIAEGRAPDAESETVDDLLGKIDAGDAYVNIHTEAHPGGEIAGQLVPFDPSMMLPPVDGGNVTPPNESKDESDDDY